MTIKYINTNGTELDITDSAVSIAYAESLGWRPAEEKPKRKRRTKEEMEADAAKEEIGIDKTNCESDLN